MITTLVLLALAAPAWAQVTRSHDYVFGAGGETGGGTSASRHVGAGGEAVFAKHFGIGAELGWLTAARDFDSGFGVFSPNGYVHIPTKSRVDPYVTGGYTLFFRSGHANLFNFGGGLNWWFRDGLGLKVELRDHVWTSRYTEHFWGVRVGLNFR